jgi:mycoredoxin-dependent peroxiredoxin
VLEIGRPAPDFRLQEDEHTWVALGDYRGRRNVLLVFHPFSFTSVCEAEMCTLRDHGPEYDAHDTELISVACDAWYIRAAWKHSIGAAGRYVADFWPHGEASRAYGVFDEREGCPFRGTFLIDRDGILRYQQVRHDDEERDEAAYRAAMAAL